MEMEIEVGQRADTQPSLRDLRYCVLLLRAFISTRCYVSCLKAVRASAW